MQRTLGWKNNGQIQPQRGCIGVMYPRLGFSKFDVSIPRVRCATLDCAIRPGWGETTKFNVRKNRIELIGMAHGEIDELRQINSDGFLFGRVIR